MISGSWLGRCPHPVNIVVRDIGVEKCLGLNRVDR